MHARTAATLEELRGVEWFRSVGIRDTAAAEVLSSWREALDNCSSPQWQDLILEASNQLCARLVERAPERFNQWNDIVLSLRPLTRAIVNQKTQHTIEKNNLPQVFLNTVNWDILHLCMEAEYADICPPGFFASQSFWYAKGHFPCGWRGEFPKGNLVIY